MSWPSRNLYTRVIDLTFWSILEKDISKQDLILRLIKFYQHPNLHGLKDSFLICIYGWWLILVPFLVLFTFNLSVKKKRMFRRQLWPVHVPHHGIRQLEWCYFGFLGMTVFWYHDKPSFYWCQFAGLCFEIISTLCFTENKKVG